MNKAVLRVEGSDLALADVRRILRLNPSAEWREGDLTRRGRVRTASGFGLTIADAETTREMESEVRAFLELCHGAGVRFAALGLAAELDIGVTVGDSEQYTASVTFQPEDLVLFGQIELALRISAYPTSDEANEKG